MADISISVFSNRNGHSAMFYYKGQIYTFFGNSAREAKAKAERKAAELTEGSLF